MDEYARATLALLDVLFDATPEEIAATGISTNEALDNLASLAESIRNSDLLLGGPQA